MRIETVFDISDRVYIDGDESIRGIILAVNIRGPGLNTTYDVAWFHNGTACSAWIEEGRLRLWAA